MPMFTETPLPQNIMTAWIVHPVMHAAAIVKSIGSTYAGWGYDLGRRLSGKGVHSAPFGEQDWAPGRGSVSRVDPHGAAREVGRLS